MNIKSKFMVMILICGLLEFTACNSDISSSSEITSFFITSPEIIGTIDTANHTITVTVPYGTDVTALVPAITYTGRSIRPASGAAQNFTGAVTYTVTAEDATAKDYTVTVKASARYFAYVANYSSSNVSAYAVDISTGELTQLEGSPFSVGFSGAATCSIAADPAGKFICVANMSPSNVSVFTIDSATGALSGPTTVSAGLYPHSVAVDPTGRFIYLPGYWDKSIYALTRNSTTGALTNVPGSPFSTGTNDTPYGITVDPAGKFLYSANFSTNTITAFKVDPITGALTEIDGSPVSTGKDTNPMSVTVDPAGKFVYAGNSYTSSVSAFTIDSIGALSAVNGSPFTAGIIPVSIAVDPAGKFAYVANSENTVSAYTRNSVTGALTGAISSSYSVGFPSSVTVDPTGKFAYVTDRATDSVYAYCINSVSGTLSLTGIYSAGTDPFSIVIVKVEE